ncbi:hypothetical protein BCR34DRAFT_554164 [Clohesyomyces aquaticus]|uniref:Uncharacterized protein n=1 Tax=Clohesyomyces aquaticus TaxID=1231657 RepID=A0A1Y2A7C6_9PLEO|nr:hypothetical protein BCR34DRAFT_554164 [Clohesyomyces aquaticus]
MLDESTPVVLTLALAPDGANIALGCGSFTLVYRVLNSELRGPWKLSPPTDLGNRAVRVHKLNFSIDSKRLISSIQVEKNSHKHAVYVAIWTCFGADLTLESQLDPVSLTVVRVSASNPDPPLTDKIQGYADDTGLSSISLVGHADSRLIQQVFLTAVLSKPYPSTLFVTPGSKSKHLDLPDARIDTAAQSQSDGSSHLFAVRSGRHKIIRVDVRNGTAELVANFSADRKGIHQTKEDKMSLSMEGSDTVNCIWRTADEGLALKTSVLANGKWTCTTRELGGVFRQLSGMA